MFRRGRTGSQVILAIYFLLIISAPAAIAGTNGLLVAIQAIMRADRAEEIARLEHDLALKAEMAVQQKEQLELSIQKIVEVHTRVANGDFNARVPLTRDNMLWQISGSLNNLLSRLQRFRHEVNELQQVKLTLQQALEENRQLKNYIAKNAH